MTGPRWDETKWAVCESFGAAATKLKGETSDGH